MALALCLAVLASCGRSEPGDSASPTTPRPAVSHGALEVDAQARTYRVFAPPTIETGTPTALVMALHDSFGTAERFRDVTQFDAAAVAGNFVVVYPESLGDSWNAGFCCGRPAREGTDDVGFLVRLLDELERTYPIDPTRVYAVGASAGAMMAYRLGCDRADRVVGVASVGGTMVVDDCHPEQPVSILAIHGTEDGEVPYDGGPTSGSPIAASSQPELINAWAELNGCSESSESQADGPVTAWRDCREGTSVRLITVRGGGHTWFSSDFDGPAGAVDATRAITEFFELTPA